MPCTTEMRARYSFLSCIFSGVEQRMSLSGHFMTWTGDSAPSLKVGGQLVNGDLSDGRQHSRTGGYNAPPSLEFTAKF